VGAEEGAMDKITLDIISKGVIIQTMKYDTKQFREWGKLGGASKSPRKQASSRASPVLSETPFLVKTGELCI
jgi:hypothetical protein